MIKSEKPESENNKNISVLGLFKYADKKDKLIILLGIICSIANGASQPLMTIILGEILESLTIYPSRVVYDPILAKEDLDNSVKKLVFAFVYLAIGTFIVSYIQLVCWMVSGERQTLKIRNEYFKAVTKQEISWFDNESSGNISSRISGDVSLIQEGISEKLGTYIQCLSTFITGFTIAYIKGWKLALVMTSAIPLIVASGVLIGKIISGQSTSGQNSFGEAAAIAEEVLSGIKTVFAFCRFDKELNRYEQKIEKARKIGNKKGFYMGFGFGTMFFCLFSTYALGYWYGSKLIINGELNISNVLNVFFSIIVGAMSLGHTGNSVSALSTAKGAALKIFGIIEKESKIDPYRDSGLKPDNINGEIRFSDVGFSYPSRKDIKIIDGLNLIIPSGKTVALVGSSGSGKSTCIQLIERFYDPESGVIYLDDVDIKSFNVSYLRQNIGIVGQEPILFGTTIYQNVAWGSIDYVTPPTLDEVIEVCKLSNAHDFIMKLPKQYETIVGEKGGLLSGGQKQRIAIARAIIKNPKILLLDEATSALDTNSEKIVQNALDKASKNRTTIIIAHRLCTIKNSDLIYVMNKGKVVEKGNHKELIQLGGTYSELVKNQELRVENESFKIKNEDDPILFEDKEIKFCDDKYINRIDTVSSYVEGIKNKSKPFIRILKYASKKKLLLGFAIFGTLIDGAILPVYSIIFTNIMENLSLMNNPEKVQNGINFWTSMFLVLGSVAFFAQLCRQGFFEMVGQDITKKVRYESFKALLNQEMKFFDKEENSIGVLSAKLSTEADQAKNLVTDVFAIFFFTLSSVMVSFALAFTYGWKLALVVIACLPALILAISLQSKIFDGYSMKIKKSYESSSQIAVESIVNIRTLASLAREKTFLEIFKTRNNIPHKLAIKSAIYGGIGFGLSQSLNFLFNAVGYYYGSRLVISGEYSIKNMLQTLTAIMFLGIALGYNSQHIKSYSKAKAACLEFFKLIDYVPSINVSSDNGDSLLVKGNCEAKNVNFSYPTRKQTPILNRFSLKILESKKIALVGTSGCGKSTFLSLLQRLYDTDSGDISTEKLNIKEWNLKKLRSNIAVVGQEPVLFDYSIYENIAYGKENASFDDVIHAAKLANAHDFIMSFPDGYNTRVGERGGQMSGGQKQRIAIARALIRNPPLLLLDEATSALDSESEKIVQYALDNVSNNRTCISIAHRLSTIQNFDLIVVMKDGEVVEMGKHDELLKNRNLYFELANQQNLN